MSDKPISEGFLYATKAQTVGELGRHMTPADVSAFPETPVVQQMPELNADLKVILGFQNFQLCPMAHLFQKTTNPEIPRRAEEEQAFMLHYLLNLYLANPSNWREVLEGEIKSRQEMLRVQQEERDQQEEEARTSTLLDNAFPGHEAE